MFVDASAIVAIVVAEDDGPALAKRLDEAERPYTSALAIYEAVLGIARSRDMPVSAADQAVQRFIEHTRTEILPISDEIGRLAIDAFDRFGRGRHPARLNMGDCFAYACARSLGVPLLYKGEDFPQTDIAVA